MVLYRRGVMEPIHANHTLQDFGPDDISKKRKRTTFLVPSVSSQRVHLQQTLQILYDFICIVKGSEDRRTEASRDLVTSSPLELDALGIHIHTIIYHRFCCSYFAFRRFLQRSVRALCPCNCTAQVMIFWAATVPRHFSSSCVRYVQDYAYIIHT